MKQCKKIVWVISGILLFQAGLFAATPPVTLPQGSSSLISDSEFKEVIINRKKERARYYDKAEALVEKMTLGEKLALINMKSYAVSRFDIPAHDWWNEALSGVAKTGIATQFPQSIAMASTWNPELIEEMASAISDEARAKYHNAGEPTGRFQGLTFWSPTINLARDPRWGRNEETYGEDPWLTSRIAIGFVKGLQGYDSKYLKTVATVKHFIANNHENDRTRDRPDVPEQFLRDYYMIPYKAAIQEADVRSIMSAYNGINDVPCTMNKWLLTDVLRNEWGFDGTVVTDVKAPEWLTTNHRKTASDVEASAAMLDAGVDVICGLKDFGPYVQQAIEDGLVSEEELDQAVTQNLSTRMEFGQVIDDSDNPYTNIPFSVVGSTEHRAIARKVAQQGTILLKNENKILPINSEKIERLILAGPYANVAPLGGYFGTPTITPISPLAGLSAVASERGMEVIHINSGEEYTPVLSANLRPAAGVDGDVGLKGEYFEGTELQGSPSTTRLDQSIDFNWPKPIENIDPDIPQPTFSVRWTGQLVPDLTGEFRLAVDSDDGVRVWLDDVLIIDDWTARAVKRNESEPVMLTAGESYDLRVEYFDAGWDASVKLYWMLPAVTEVDSYDPETTMVVYVGGFDIEDADEFFDLANLELKSEQLQEIQGFYSEYTNTVVVLNGGTIVPSDWLFENIPAVLHAWYLGQEGGDALADLLFGKVSPSGHLPMTYYQSENDLPPIKDYDLSKGRTYMYFNKPVTYPFGYGLSYTEFEYGELSVNVESASTDAPSVTVSIPVTNTGDMEADDVVQLYVRDVKRNPKAYNPIKQLRGFERLSLKPGETKIAEFELDRSAFAYWDVDKDEYIVEPGEFEIQVGASSADIHAQYTFEATSASVTNVFDTSFTAAEGFVDGDLAGQNNWQALSATGAEAFNVQSAGDGFAETATFSNSFNTVNGNYVFYGTAITNTVNGQVTGSMTFRLECSPTPGFFKTVGPHVQQVADLADTDCFDFGLSSDTNTVFDKLQSDDVVITARTMSDAGLQFVIKNGTSDPILTLDRQTLGWDPEWADADETNAPVFVSDWITLDWTVRKTVTTNTYAADVDATINGTTHDGDMRYSLSSLPAAAYAAGFTHFCIGLNNDAQTTDQGSGTGRIHLNMDSVSVTHIGNAAPMVSAGADQTIQLPTDQIALDGTVTDDGLPEGATVSTAWSVVSGPGPVIFGNENSIDTTATFSDAGTYVLRLTASDTELSTSDNVQITVMEEPVPGDVAAAINCGGSAYTATDGTAYSADIYYSGESTYSTSDPIAGTEDDILYQTERYNPGDLIYSIPVANGDYQVTLKMAEIYQTAVGDRLLDVSIEGTQVIDDLDLIAVAGHDVAYERTFSTTVSDGVLTIQITGVVDTAQMNAILVGSSESAANTAPVVDAGTDQTIELPTDQVALNGVVTDDDLPTNTVTTTWSKVSGLGTVTFADAASVVTTATFSTDGTYVLRLTADDGELSSSDDVQITVEAEPVVNFSEWIEAYEVGAQNAPGDDPDGDGVPNLLEFAFGTSPTSGGSYIAMPAGAMVESGGSDFMTLTYRRLTGGTGTTGVDYTVRGITYTVEYENDLTLPPWSSGGLVPVGEPIDNGDGTETVTVRLPDSITSETKQFMRLKVTLAAP